MAFIFSTSPIYRLVLKYKRKIGLLGASVFVNAAVFALVVFFANWSSISVPDLQAIDPNAYVFIELEEDVLAEEVLTPDTILPLPDDLEIVPPIPIKPKELLEFPQEIAESAPIEVETNKSEAELIDQLSLESDNLPEKIEKSDPEISEKWRVNPSEMTLEEQSTRIILQSDSARNEDTGAMNTLRRTLGGGACLDRTTSKNSGYLCSNMDAFRLYLAEDWKNENLLDYAVQFPKSNEVPFVKREEFNLKNGPMPTLIAPSHLSRSGGVESGALPNPHPHPYDEVTR